MLKLPGCSAGLTGFPGALQEGVHGGAVAIGALRGHGGDVVPLQRLQQRHHGLGLGSVRSNHPGEEVVAPLVAQLRCRGAVAHLRDLEGAESQGHNLVWFYLFIVFSIDSLTLPRVTNFTSIHA